MTLIYKINDLERKIPYKQWEALKKEFVEFAKEKKQLEANIDEAYKLLDEIDEYMLTEQHLKLVEAKKLLERGKE